MALHEARQACSYVSIQGRSSCQGTPPLDVAKNLEILIGTLIGNRHDLNSSSRLDFLCSKSALANCLADKLLWHGTPKGLRGNLVANTVLPHNFMTQMLGRWEANFTAGCKSHQRFCQEANVFEIFRLFKKSSAVCERS